MQNKHKKIMKGLLLVSKFKKCVCMYVCMCVCVEIDR